MRMQLLSKTALITVLALISAPAVADTDKNGFYAGIVAGYSYTDLDLEAAPIGGTTNQFDQKYLHAGEFGLVGGYHHKLPRSFFVEAEVEALVSMGRETGLFNSDLKVEKDNAFGIYLKPGYQINDKWGAFVTLGAQWIEYTAINDSINYEESDRSAGFLHGIGVNYALDKDVTLTAEYNRVQPLDVTYEIVPGATTSRFDPELDIVKLALKYNF